MEGSLTKEGRLLDVTGTQTRAPEVSVELFKEGQVYLFFFERRADEREVGKGGRGSARGEQGGILFQRLFLVDTLSSATISALRFKCCTICSRLLPIDTDDGSGCWGPAMTETVDARVLEVNSKEDGC